MRLILLPVLGAAAAAAAPVEQPGQPVPETVRPQEACLGDIPVFNPEGCPPHAISIDTERLQSSSCGDRIEQVREANGQPKLDRAPASAEKPLLIAAVDKRIDGCAVMQMKGDVNDLRPIPQAMPNGVLQPAN